ncbi:uncharacterized [Tachysurus ichikawai]
MEHFTQKNNSSLEPGQGRGQPRHSMFLLSTLYEHNGFLTGLSVSCGWGKIPVTPALHNLVLALASHGLASFWPLHHSLSTEILIDF